MIPSPRANRPAASSRSRSRRCCSAGVYPPRCAYRIPRSYARSQPTSRPKLCEFNLGAFRRPRSPSESSPLERALQPRYLAWLAHENAAGANVYVAANPLAPGSRKRTKESIAEVRHLYLDLDTDGDAKLDRSTVVEYRSRFRPQSSSTSAGKYQVLWRVERLPFEQQESLLKVLAITFGGDPACTDLNRVLRLPGFLNQKYAPAPVVTVEYPSDSTWHSEDFQLANPEPNRELIRTPSRIRKAYRESTPIPSRIGRGFSGN